MLSKIIGYIILICFYFIFSLILRYIEKNNRDRIIRIETTKGDYHSAIEARTNTLRIRKRFIRFSLILMAILSAVISTAFVIVQADSSVSGLSLMIEWIVVFCLSFIIFSMPIRNGSSVAESMIGNIASETIEDALASNTPFYLFLRGFKADDRDKSISSVKNNLYYPGFSEYYFVKGLQTTVGKIYAIGDPKEVDAPYGAVRIYLDLKDDKWEEDVLRLMDKAKKIYVMISNTVHCRWELNQALSYYPQKTFLIVSDVDEYNAVRQMGFDHLPVLHPCNGWFCYMLQRDNEDINMWLITRHKKTAAGYEKINNSSTCKLSGLRLLGRLLLSLAALTLILLLAGREWNRRSENIRLEKECRQYWSTKEQVEIDSILVVQQCSFSKQGLVINAIAIDSTICAITEVQAANCFFFLADYDIMTMRECMKLLRKDGKPLHIIVKDHTNNTLLCDYEYTSESGFSKINELLKQQDRGSHINKKASDAVTIKHTLTKSLQSVKPR